MKITSNFAVLDVKDGRQELNRHFAGQSALGGDNPELRIPITITGYIDCVWGDDDGISREFGIVVEKLILEPPPRGIV